MALFTDGPPATIDDLTALDTQLLEVAHVEGIDVTQKLALAQAEIGLELETMLADARLCEPWLWGNQWPSVAQVVVTPSLKLWHGYRALEMVYGDAYNSQLNDRYAGKRDQFHERAQWAGEKLREIGIGMAARPVPKATSPTVTTAQPASGFTLADGTYYVTAAWVNRDGEEGAAADATAVTTASSSLMVQAAGAPETAAGWNVFVGTDPGTMTLQNDSPLAVGQVWIQANGVTTTGRAPGTGQTPTLVRTAPRTIQRG